MNPLHVIIRLVAAARSRGRNLWFRALGVQLTGYVWMRRVSIPRQWSDITIEASACLDDGVTLLCGGPPKRDKLVIRAGTYVNRLAILDAHEHLEVGRNCMIGPGCFLTDSDHRTDSAGTVGQQPMISAPTVLEDGVWLGAGVKVLKGVRLGQGAVVGAGAVVTKDVEPFQIVAGVPARAIGTRELS